MEFLGAAASIIAILETTIRTIDRILQVSEAAHGFPERAKLVFRKCQFDSNSIRHLIALLRQENIGWESDADTAEVEGTFDYLLEQLQMTGLQVDRWAEDTPYQRLKWGLRGEKRLNEVEKELFMWSQRLHIRFAGLVSHIDGGLNRADPDAAALLEVPLVLSQQRMRRIVLNAQEDDHALLAIDPHQLTYRGDKSSKLAQMAATLVSKGETRDVIVEIRNYGITTGSEEFADTAKAMSSVSAILNQVETTEMGILKGLGYFHDTARHSFGVVLQKPAGRSDFICLDKLIATKPRHSLGQRFELAERIVTAVAFVHAVGWVHKNIQPRNIILFANQGESMHDAGSDKKLGKAFLVGFDSARSREHQSWHKESPLWREKIYKHPERQGYWPETFTAKHDIYALGVLLLELALWAPLADRTIGEGEATVLVFEDALPEARKERLEAFARSLDRVVGIRYRDLVLRCLTTECDNSSIRGLLDELLRHLEKLATSI